MAAPICTKPQNAKIKGHDIMTNYNRLNLLKPDENKSCLVSQIQLEVFAKSDAKPTSMGA
jgi:hypothetical protein